MNPTERRLPGWALPAGLALVVVALVTIALTRNPVGLDPDTAEGTVQEYLQAISDQRWDDAIEVIHDDWRGSCQGSDLQVFAQGDFTARLGAPDGAFGFDERTDFVPIDEGTPTIPENSIQVDVTINHREGGGFGSTWDEHVVFELTLDDEFWWIVGDPWPYFTFDCREG